MKSLVAIILVVVSLCGFLLARQGADRRRTESVMQWLCGEIQDDRRRTSQLPPSLDVMAESGQAGGLGDLTKGVSIAYDPGNAQNRLPRLTVSVGRTFMAVQGPCLEYPR